MLSAAGIEAAYGPSRVLFGIDLDLAEGEALALIGRNGMGKTTLIRTIMGLLPPQSGHVSLDGAPLAGRPPHVAARRGLGLVPEGRQVFPSLTVEENLIATARPGPAGRRDWTLETIGALFPRLAERRRQPAGLLSGGEQQMLAIGRALMTNPRVLLLDEASEGLAPLIQAEIWRVLARLRDTGIAILVVDKDLTALSRLVDRFAIMEKGRIVWTGDTAAFNADPELARRHLGV